MNNQLTQILSDSEIQSEVPLSHRIFTQHDYAAIPDFMTDQSASSVNIKSPEEENTYHCITTHGQVQKTAPVVQSDKIGDIIKRLDMQADGEQDIEETEYLTKGKFAAVMGDMRVDILSMVNLLGCLNNCYTSSNTELNNIKRDVYKIIQENQALKKKVADLKTDHEKRYNALAKTYEQRFEEIFKRLNRHDASEAESVFEKPSRRIRSSKASGSKVTKSKSKSKSDDDNDQSNALIDSQIEKRANKFRVVPKRSLKHGGADTFGNNQDDDINQVVYTQSTRQVNRRDNFDNVAKKTNDSREYRMKRLGLKDSYSIKRR